MYEVKFSTASQKYLKKLNNKKLKNSFYENLKKICEDPYLGKQKTGDLASVYSYDFYYDGVNYEIAYLISEVKEKIVVVLLAGTRENLYKELKKMYKK